MLRIGRGRQGLGGLFRRAITAAAVSAVTVPVACGNSDDEAPPLGDDAPKGGSGFSGGSGGTSGQGGGGSGGMAGEGGEAPTDPLAPTVRITSPDNLRHPDDGAVLVEPEVEVVCEATRSAAPDSEVVGSVRIRMLDAEGGELDAHDAAQTELGVFVASFFLQDVPNGPVHFVCSAGDVATPPHVGSHEISTFVDHGPLIEIESPLENAAYSLLTPVPFVFRVSPDPLVDDDPGADVDLDTVRLTVLGQNIELEEDDGKYTATVRLSDEDLFPDPPPTVAVLFAAKNVREPVHGEAIRTYNIQVDSAGPIISVTSPDDADVVGGEVILRFSVADEGSGVDEASVFVTFNGGEPIYFDSRNGWSRDGSNFSYRFDTTAIVGSIAQVTVNIEAKDGAGNDAEGESLLLYLDNLAPIVDLNPPMIREYRLRGQTKECSVAFDPVGPSAKNDLDTTVRSAFLRTLVWERTNPAMFPHHAGVDRESVYLYLQIDPSKPLLVSTDRDSECEDLDPSLPFIHLTPITPTATAFYGSEGDEPTGAPAFPDACAYANETVRPPALCRPPSSDLYRVIPWDYDTKVPAIYGVPPLADPACTGLDWEIGATNGIQEGWVCVAARAVDNAGNVGVSAPLRLCYDDGVGTPADCSDPPPSCTDGCTVSAVNQFPPNRVLLDPP